MAGDIYKKEKQEIIHLGGAEFNQWCLGMATALGDNSISSADENGPNSLIFIQFILFSMGDKTKNGSESSFKIFVCIRLDPAV